MGNISATSCDYSPDRHVVAAFSPHLRPEDRPVRATATAKALIPALTVRALKTNTRVSSENERLQKQLAEQQRQLDEYRVTSAASIDDFVPLHLVGCGSYGAVFRVHYALKPDSKFVIKLLLHYAALETPAADTPSQIMNRHLIECRNLSSIPHHPAIVHHLAQFLARVPRSWLAYVDQSTTVLHELAETRCLAVVYPFRGETLSALVAQAKSHSAKSGIVVNVLRTLLPALEHLVQHHVVHRDIKGDNILIQSDGSACLIDFGGALVLRDSLNFTLQSSETEVWLNPFFTPPEVDLARHVARCRTVTLDYGRADLWALAATCYDALLEPSARFPSDQSRLFRLEHLPALSTAVPVVLTLLLADMLKPHPEHRPSFASLRERVAQMSG